MSLDDQGGQEAQLPSSRGLGRQRARCGCSMLHEPLIQGEVTSLLSPQAMKRPRESRCEY